MDIHIFFLSRTARIEAPCRQTSEVMGTVDFWALELELHRGIAKAQAAEQEQYL
jgi:hypothetical protein